MLDDINKLASSSNTTLRPEFVENARRFFKNPKINSTPIDEQKKFLLGKGVTQAEIDAALESVPEIELAANKTALPIYYQTPPPVPPTNTVMNVAQSTVIIAGATYIAYKFVRSWLLPKFFDIADPADEERKELHNQLNELQNTTKFVMDSVSQCSDTVQAQQEQLNRALTLISNNGKGSDLQRLQTDISVIKSLLLRGDQFPSIPAMNNGTDPNAINGPTNNRLRMNGQMEIPAWQLNKEESSDSSTTFVNSENAGENSTSSSNNDEVEIFDDASS